MFAGFGGVTEGDDGIEKELGGPGFGVKTASSIGGGGGLGDGGEEVQFDGGEQDPAGLKRAELLL